MGFGGGFSGGGSSGGGSSSSGGGAGNWVRNDQAPGEPLFSISMSERTFNIIFYTVCVVIVLALAHALISPFASSLSHFIGLDIPASTVERTALEAVASEEAEYYADEGEIIILDYTLTKGLAYFYEETGVRPYIYFLPNGSVLDVEELADLAEELYYDLFPDEAHFLVVFCRDGSRSYALGYYVGDDAATVVDEQAIDIFAAVLNYHYSDTSILWTVEKALSNTFEDTADRIMSTQIPNWTKIMIIVVGIGVIVLALFFAIRKQLIASKEKQMQQNSSYTANSSREMPSSNSSGSGASLSTIFRIDS